MVFSKKCALAMGLCSLLLGGAASAQVPSPCPGDANNDLEVNVHDMVQILERLGNVVPRGERALERRNLVGNGRIDQADLTVVLANIGQSCKAANITCRGDLNGDGQVNALDIAENLNRVGSSANTASSTNLEYVMNAMNIADNWGSCSETKPSALSFAATAKQGKAARTKLRQGIASVVQ